MNEQKSIYDCYEEIKHREISELKEAVLNAGGEVEFNEDSAPIVMVNFDGYAPHPADVRIKRVRIKDDEILIDGEEKCSSGCSDWFEEEKPIDIEDIAYGHIDFITSDVRGSRKAIKHYVWMRLGVTLEGSEREINSIVGSKDDADEILRDLLKQGRYRIDGESYIPECEVEDYNIQYGTSHEVGDIEFNL